MRVNLGTFSEGLIDDADVTFEEVRFCKWDYDGGGPETLALRALLKPENEEPTYQYYSCGEKATQNLIVVEDGKALDATGSTGRLSKSSNAAQFIQSILDAGFPPDRLTEDISVLDGLKAHVNRIPQKKRSGLVTSAREGEEQREKTILVVSQILALPGEKGKAKSAGKAAQGKAAQTKAQTQAPSTQAADNGEIEHAEYLQNILLGILAEAEGTIQKKDLAVQVMKAVQKDENKPAKLGDLVKAAMDEGFLGGEGMPWSYNEGILSIE